MGLGGGECRFYFHGRADFSELFISRDTCSDRIARVFRACFSMGYRTSIARHVAKRGIARMCLRIIKYKGGVSHLCGGVPTSLTKHRAIWGIAAIVS